MSAAPHNEAREALAGAWTITAPDGRVWTGDSPVRAASAAQRDTIDPVLAMQRINAMVDEENVIRDAELAEAFERGRQQGMDQERALWELARDGQEIEAVLEGAGDAGVPVPVSSGSVVSQEACGSTEPVPDMPIGWVPPDRFHRSALPVRDDGSAVVVLLNDAKMRERGIEYHGQPVIVSRWGAKLKTTLAPMRLEYEDVVAWCDVATLLRQEACDAGASVPKGWRLVPEQPTVAMETAGFATACSHAYLSVWRDMLAAAPSPNLEWDAYHDTSMSSTPGAQPSNPPSSNLDAESSKSGDAS